MPRKRIILVEDEPDMADLVAGRLTREGYEVDVARDGAVALQKISASPPDLVLLDLMLPGLSGTEVIAALRSESRTACVPVIMLTARSEESDVVVGLKLGADDYVTKPFNMSVLVARIEALLRRMHDASRDGGLLSVGCIQIDRQRYEVAVDSEPVLLTLTEFRLLEALAGARGRVLSRNQLMDKAMGADAVVTDRTIDVHMTALRRKLRAAKGMIRTVRGVGYRLVCEGGDDQT